MEPPASPLVGMDQVDDAVEDTLKAWLPRYVVRAAWQRDIDAGNVELIDPTRDAQWHLSSDPRELTPEQSPSVVVGAAEVADRRGRARGLVDLTWTIHVACYVRGVGRRHTRTLCGIYVTAMSAVLDVHLRGHPLVGSVTVEQEAQDLLSVTDERSIAGGLVRCAVEVPAARATVPLEQTPPADPFADLPEHGEIAGHTIQEA